MHQQGAGGAPADRHALDRHELDRHELVRATFGSMSAFVLVVDALGVPLLVNAALVDATGWTEAELMARPFWETLVAPEDVAGATDHVDRAISRGEVFPQEGDWMDRRGGRRRVWTQNSVIRDDDGAPWAVVTVGVDVTEQRRAEALLRHRAETDTLTGLSNRAALLERLAATLADPAGAGCGVLFADLDGFKGINDDHGHHVGDLVLVEVAARLRRVTSTADVVARLGGDEFVVLCPGADEARITALARRVERRLTVPVPTPSGSVHTGVSIGTATGAPGAEPDELLRVADRRMYRSKLARRSAGDAGARRVAGDRGRPAGTVVVPVAVPVASAVVMARRAEPTAPAGAGCTSVPQARAAGDVASRVAPDDPRPQRPAPPG